MSRFRRKPIYEQISDEIDSLTHKYGKPPERLCISKRHYALLLAEVFTYDELDNGHILTGFYDTPIWVIDFIDIGWFLVEPKS